jgi:ribonuclease-3
MKLRKQSSSKGISFEKLNILYEKIEYLFKKRELIEGALTHPRILQEAKGISNSFYERLEFLGDRVLALTIAEMLYKTFPQSSEGDLSKRLTALVRQETLIYISKEIGLTDILHPVKGEEKIPAAIIADSCEALIGALYLDGGLDSAKSFIVRFWSPLMKEAITVPQDYKSSLQEWAQSLKKSIPIYKVLRQEGFAHAPTFYIEVQIEENYKAEGSGNSKRIAEQNAAFALLEKIKEQNT